MAGLRSAWAFAAVAGVFMAVALAPNGPARAGEQVDIITNRGLIGFGHMKRVTQAHCLDRNYWWFYRPYTTAGENFPRCEPYFHYPDGASGTGNAWADRAMK
ncbi:hypothetical protein [Methyloceanibacter sp.]|uniref:hypothetical protein n=1 Tax=Methyloceanibacter sp. TaxID=1965321 RepID=UPI002CA0AD7C|nr:hypothetical protein [Methyloceanibacter sp.]HML92003.1 hypothetical protein [Methyloceanibacter sp.]